MNEVTLGVLITAGCGVLGIALKSILDMFGPAAKLADATVGEAATHFMQSQITELTEARTEVKAYRAAVRKHFSGPDACPIDDDLKAML